MMPGNKSAYSSEDSDQEPEYVNAYFRNPPTVMSAAASGQKVTCHRCANRVYATERVDIGVVFHQTCFRCIECSMILSLNNFILCKPTANSRKDVYCRAHVPKPVSHTLDEEAFDIRSAVRAQRLGKKLSFNNQVRLPSDMAGWEYDLNAMEFTHVRELSDRNRQTRRDQDGRIPDELIYERGDMWRKLKDGSAERESVHSLAQNLANQNTGDEADNEYMNPPPLWQPDGHVLTIANIAMSRGDRRSRHVPEDPCYSVSQALVGISPHHPNDTLNITENFYEKLKPPHKENGCENVHYTQTYANPEQNVKDKQEKLTNGELEPGASEAPPLPRKKEYLTDQAFMEQNKLEMKQRREHGLMFREFEAIRDERNKNLVEDIRAQQEEAFTDLLSTLQQGEDGINFEIEKKKIEKRFQELKEEKMRSLESQIIAQERARVDVMTEEQTKEMLQLFDKKNPLELPPAQPPSMKKAQLMENTPGFDDVDFHAVQVARDDQSSFTEWIYELSLHCHTQLEKVRGIFRWLAAKDLNKMIFYDDITDDSPYHFLKGIKLGIESYHELFKRLCSYAGIHVKIVSGYSKCAGYRAGMPYNDPRFRNSWTVVLIDGTWRFVDTHWGARHVTTSSEQSMSNIYYELDEFFFLCNPEDHIYMHYPDEKEWQLLDQPLNPDEFARLPVLKSHFFRYGLELVEPMAAILKTDTGLVEIILRMPHSTSCQLSFSMRLELNEEELNGYDIFHRTSDEIIFNLNLPQQGIFYFSIFACNTLLSETYNCVCSFRIECSKVISKPFGRFPKLHDGYGPTELAKELGLTVDRFNEYYIVCSEDKLKMNIKFNKTVKMSHKLVCGNNSEDLDLYAFQRYRDSRQVNYLIRFPERGVYAFSIFAAERSSTAPVLGCVCRYLIQCNNKGNSQIRPYPKVHQFWLKCRLYEPTSGVLKVNRDIKFKVEVPDCNAVAVIIGGQWFYLTSADNKVWQGSAFTRGDENSSVFVYAKYNAQDFLPILEYSLTE